MIASTQTSQQRDQIRTRAGFAALTVVQQQALYMTVVDRSSVASVASKLDLPADTVERIVAAAKAKLHQAVIR